MVPHTTGPFGICSADWHMSAGFISRTGLFSAITLVAALVSRAVTQGCGLPLGTVNGQPVTVPLSPMTSGGALSTSTLAVAVARVPGMLCGHWMAVAMVT